MPSDPDLRWEPHFVGCDSIWYLLRGTDQLSRVARRVDGRTWLSEVARHRRDWRKRPQLIVASRALAMRWAERWTRANLARTLEIELPPMWRMQCGVLTQATFVRTGHGRGESS
jgi:hypothetical protein